jgi:hypothetical protein
MESTMGARVEYPEGADVDIRTRDAESRERDDDTRERDTDSDAMATKNDGRMTDEERAQLKALQERSVAEENEESEPNEDNFTHHVHLADGRVVKARSGAGTVFSEGRGTKDDPERFTPIIGVYAR